MTVRQRYDGIVAWFSEHMPAAESELRYKDPYQLLVAVILWLLPSCRHSVPTSG